jgi:hypothetical protein
VISVQTSPGGTIAWGIYMYDPDNRYGAWVVDVMVGTKRDDRKVQDYEPHGSVASESARPGLVFSLEASMTNENGRFVNVPDRCLIP